MSEWKCRYAFGKECQVAECKYEVCDLPLVYQQGRADAFDKIIKFAHEDCTTGNMIISLNDVEKLKDNS